MASKSTSVFSSLLRRQPRLSATTRISASRPSPTQLPFLRSTTLAPKPYPAALIRLAHSIPRPPPVQPREPSLDSSEDSTTDATATGTTTPTSEGERPSIPTHAPYYQLSFTCVPCGHRSHHNVSKQGYHKGSTLITCPECRNRHIISDHLGIFGDRKITVEDLLREKGQLVKRGSLGEDGDIEFWPEEEIEAQSGSS